MICLSTSLFAQKRSIKDSVIQLAPVVISASRFEEPKAQTSHYSITSSKEEISFQTPQTSADLLGAHLHFQHVTLFFLPNPQSWANPYPQTS